MATSKENFDDWIQNYLQGKRNTVLMTDETYKEIVDFLLGNNLPNKCDCRIEKRVKRHNYQLMNYHVLGLLNILCVPCNKEVKLKLKLPRNYKITTKLPRKDKTTT